ncbi:MAG TPA: hypothetical protein VI111_03845 [Thermoleophilaceae bacterium]
MHLRRALLLFAIVLGLAAIAASISRPANVDDEPPPAATEAGSSPSISPGPGHGAPAELAFDASTPQRRQLDAGRAATISVAVAVPGTIAIPALGISATAEPLTPARFDVLAREPGRYRIRFRAAGEAESRLAGTLLVRPTET